jgi:hypothetical protein
MVAYATIDQLADALRTSVSAKNSAWLQSSLDAAAAEIDHTLDRPADQPLPDPPPALATTVNVARAIEWYKANDSAFGAVGFADIGVLVAPGVPFKRHANSLIPLKIQFGIG